MILALDPATKCGWALSPEISGVWDLSIRADESKGMRLLRFKAKLIEIYESHPFKVVAYEAARAAAPGRQGALVVQASIQAVLILFCEEKGIEYIGYSPKEIKKHATGTGNANKDAMIKAAEKQWPRVVIIDDNHADALHVLSLAQSLIGKAV